jgi:hypothetical protein
MLPFHRRIRIRAARAVTILAHIHGQARVRLDFDVALRERVEGLSAVDAGSSLPSKKKHVRTVRWGWEFATGNVKGVVGGTYC